MWQSWKSHKHLGKVLKHVALMLLAGHGVARACMSYMDQC